jgi:hypothetical protein
MRRCWQFKWLSDRNNNLSHKRGRVASWKVLYTITFGTLMWTIAVWRAVSSHFGVSHRRGFAWPSHFGLLHVCTTTYFSRVTVWSGTEDWNKYNLDKCHSFIFININPSRKSTHFRINSSNMFQNLVTYASVFEIVDEVACKPEVIVFHQFQFHFTRHHDRYSSNRNRMKDSCILQ